MLAILWLNLSGCGRENEIKQNSVTPLFKVTPDSATLTPPTSIAFQVICNGGSSVSAVLNVASSSNVVVQKYVTCTLDMTSIVISGLTYTAVGTHLIISINDSGLVSSVGANRAKYVNTTSGVTNQIYFMVAGDASNTPYAINLDFSRNLSRLMTLLPRPYSAVLLPATPPTVTGATYAFNTPASTVSTTLTLSVSGAAGLLGALSCVIVRESAASAPTSQSTAASQYNAALNAINGGTTASGSYGNACATSNSIYCRCPSAFNSTLVNGVGNWDIFYSADAVIIWVNASLALNSGFTVLVVPGLS